jgi:hypothetical protein
MKMGNLKTNSALFKEWEKETEWNDEWKTWRKKVKNGEFLSRFLKEHGVRFKGAVQVFCPFHKNEHTPHAAFFPAKSTKDKDKGEHLYCFLDDVSFDFFDMAEHFLNTKGRATLDFVGTYCGIPNPAQAIEQKPKRKRTSPIVKDVERFNELIKANIKENKARRDADVFWAGFGERIEAAQKQTQKEGVENEKCAEFL